MPFALVAVLLVLVELEILFSAYIVIQRAAGSEIGRALAFK